MSGPADRHDSPLQVIGYHGTRRDDPERGPLVRLRPDEARVRLLVDGELAWVRGPRSQQLATVVIDESVPRGGVIVRDVPGVAPSEIVRITKPDLDRGPSPARFA